LNISAAKTTAMPASRYRNREHWLALAPSLHIEEQSLFENVAYVELSPELAAQFKSDGYLQGSGDWGLDVKLMADTVRSLSAADLSPLFAYLYDEFWFPFFKLNHLYRTLLGGDYYLLPDFWIWNVDPKKGEAGWKPHRDKGKKSLLEDGSPKSLTTWIPLSSATPLNGCMYVVPARHDPTYGTADEIKMKFDYQSIRALPGKPDDFFIWNQAIYHWGSRSSPRAEESRVSMAFELQRADMPPFNGPLIDPLRIPTFEERLVLIAKQIHRYRHMYELDPKVAQMASDLLAELIPAPAPASVAAATPPAAPRPAVATPVVAPATATRPAVARGSVDPSRWGKVGRNEPCPCGSGKKYKLCHGSLL
jgi:hypothetical protein